MQYGFLVVAARALGQAKFAPLSVFWALLFVCGPGFFLPLEQETGRAIAARRVRGEGGRPVVERAAMHRHGARGRADHRHARARRSDRPPGVRRRPGAARGADRRLRRLSAASSWRGACWRATAASGRTACSSAARALLRVVFAAFLAVIGVKVAGPYGVAMIVASFVAIALSPDRAPRPAPSRAARAVVGALHALGFLLIASVFTQLLLSVGAVAVQLLATPRRRARPGASS